MNGRKETKNHAINIVKDVGSHSLDFVLVKSEFCDISLAPPLWILYFLKVNIMKDHWLLLFGFGTF